MDLGWNLLGCGWNVRIGSMGTLSYDPIGYRCGVVPDRNHLFVPCVSFGMDYTGMGTTGSYHEDNGYGGRARVLWTAFDCCGFYYGVVVGVAEKEKDQKQIRFKLFKLT